MSALLVIGLVAVAVLFVTHPLRRGVAARANLEHEVRVADLQTAKEDKYREIRDAEMDRRTGKLSDEDWRALDRQLRAEAVEILHALDALEPAAAASEPQVPGDAGVPAGEDAEAEPAAEAEHAAHAEPPAPA